MSEQYSVEMLIFQTTPFCNIDCTYCYLPNRQSKARLSTDVVFNTATEIANSKWVGPSLSVVWHAGEPLAVGVEHLNNLIVACEPLNEATRVHHHVQTNATLLNAEFCDTFKRHNVRVGVSIDGPRDIHDRHRVTRGKIGTYEKVMRGIAILRENNIPFSVICVLTSASLDRARELYTFFEGIGAASVGFNVDELEGTNHKTSMNDDGFFERLTAFWQELFQVHFERRSFVLREADTLVSSLRYGTPGQVHNQQATPFSILTVSVDGSVGTFSPELLGQQHERFANFSIGHIQSDTFNVMREHPRFVSMKSEIDAGLKKCARECAYFELCGGGAPSNKLFENGAFDSSITKYCRAIKISVIDALIHEVGHQKAINGQTKECAVPGIESVLNVLNTETCNTLLEKAQRLDWTPSSINEKGTATRYFSVAKIDGKPIFSKIKSVLPAQIDGRRLSRIADERAIFLRYSEGDFFPVHQDSPYNVDDDNVSLYTLMLYLNDDYVGGATNFPDDNRVVESKAGMALIFPHHLRHEGLMVKNGLKYAIHTFIMYSR